MKTFFLRQKALSSEYNDKALGSEGIFRLFLIFS